MCRDVVCLPFSRVENLMLITVMTQGLIFSLCPEKQSHLLQYFRLPLGRYFSCFFDVLNMLKERKKYKTQEWSFFNKTDPLDSLAVAPYVKVTYELLH